MQSTTLAAPFVVQPAVRLSSLAVKVPAFIAAAFLAAVLVAQIEAVAYAANASQPDADAVYQTMMVSP
jgi:hypothetical protein